jgi:hypothetical protein
MAGCSISLGLVGVRPVSGSLVRIRRGAAYPDEGYHLAIAQGEELGVPMWVCQAARLVYKLAIFKGAAEDDISTLVRHVERGAGFEIPKTR